MIEFLCPTCKTQFRAADEQSGTKINCSKCGQRLVVPAARRNKTILGEPVPAVSAMSVAVVQQAAPSPLINAEPNQSSVSHFYYMNQGERKGPVDFPQLQRLVQTQQVDPGDLVWSSVTNAWVAAKNVEGLFPVHPVAASQTPSEATQKGRTLGWNDFFKSRSRRWWLRWLTASSVTLGVVTLLIVVVVLLNRPTSQTEINTKDQDQASASSTESEKFPNAKLVLGKWKSGAKSRGGIEFTANGRLKTLTADEFEIPLRSEARVHASNLQHFPGRT